MPPESPLFSLVAGVAAGFSFGLVAGILFSSWMHAREFAHVATFARTGRPMLVPSVPRGTAGTAPHAPDLSPEVSAAIKITDEMVRRGADELLEAARAQGIHIEEREARAEARRLLEAMHHDWKGGIPNA